MRLRLLCGGLLFGGLLGACNTPSVPLPPPDLVSLSFESKTPGLFDLVGTKSSRHVNVRFNVFDETSMSGMDGGVFDGVGVVVGTEPDGSFITPEFPAKLGDDVELFYESVSGQRSEAWLCTLALGTPNNGICH